MFVSDHFAYVLNDWSQQIFNDKKQNTKSSKQNDSDWHYFRFQEKSHYLKYLFPHMSGTLQFRLASSTFQWHKNSCFLNWKIFFHHIIMAMKLFVIWTWYSMTIQQSSNFSRVSYTAQYTAQKNEVKDFLSKCEQMQNFLWICLHLLKESSMENLIFSAVADKCLKVTLSTFDCLASKTSRFHA